MKALLKNTATITTKADFFEEYGEAANDEYEFIISANHSFEDGQKSLKNIMFVIKCVFLLIACLLLAYSCSCKKKEEYRRMDHEYRRIDNEYRRIALALAQQIIVVSVDVGPT